MKTLTVFGTRPESIKMAPIITALRAASWVDSEVCVTAQHRQMLDQVLALFDVRPDHDLNILQPDQDLTDITVSVLKGLRRVLQGDHYDLVLVHGDTTTTLSAALAAYYERIPVAHVEAGLRTGDIYAPWPEEINRGLVGRIAMLHFAPTLRAREALIREDVPASRIHVTGNTVIDALQQMARRIADEPLLQARLHRQFEFLDKGKRLILVTGHRRENFGAGLEGVCRALKRLGERGDVQVLYAAHLNPAVQRPVKAILGDARGMVLVGPQDYLPFVYLMSRAHLIITDSGGIQEEAPALGKPVLVTRNTTERPEGIEAGTAKLVGTAEQNIVDTVESLLDDAAAYDKMARAINPYGDGKAAERVLAAIRTFLKTQP